MTRQKVKYTEVELLLYKPYKQPVSKLFWISPDVILCGWLGLKHQLTN